MAMTMAMAMAMTMTMAMAMAISMAISMAMAMAMAMANILARVTANSVTFYKRGRQLTIIPNSDQCHGQELYGHFPEIERENDHKT